MIKVMNINDTRWEVNDIYIHNCISSSLVLGALVGIMAHLVWKARNNLVHKHLPISLAVLRSFFQEEALVNF